MLRRKNDGQDNATDAHDRQLDAKSKQPSETQVKPKAQTYLSIDNGLNIHRFASEKQKCHINIINADVISFFKFLLNFCLPIL